MISCSKGRHGPAVSFTRLHSGTVPMHTSALSSYLVGDDIKGGTEHTLCQNPETWATAESGMLQALLTASVL